VRVLVRVLPEILRPIPMRRSIDNVVKTKIIPVIDPSTVVGRVLYLLRIDSESLLESIVCMYIRITISLDTYGRYPVVSPIIFSSMHTMCTKFCDES
jgi:hypothetical protein